MRPLIFLNICNRVESPKQPGCNERKENKFTQQYYQNHDAQNRSASSGESLIRLLISHHTFHLNVFPVLTYAMNGALGILYFFPTLCIGNNSEYSSVLFLSVDGEMTKTAAASDVLRKLFVDFSISSKLLFFK